jgi:hypothetical protein
MSKVLRTAAIVVGAVAIAVALPGVGTAIGAQFGLSAAGVTTLGTVLNATAAGMSVSSPLRAWGLK